MMAGLSFPSSASIKIDAFPAAVTLNCSPGESPVVVSVPWTVRPPGIVTSPLEAAILTFLKYSLTYRGKSPNLEVVHLLPPKRCKLTKIQ